MNVIVGPKGRVVLSAPLRQALGFEEGTVLIARVEDDRLVLETRAAALERLRALYDGIPREVSLVDELIAERRREAARAERDLR